MARATKAPSDSAAATSVAEPSQAPPPVETRSKLPAPPSRTLSIDQILEYWNGIEELLRPRLLGYLYRLWPIINRTPGYIDKISQPPADAREFLKQWGTGEYELMLTDLDKPKGGQICRARFKFAERIDEYPPVLDAVDLDVGRKENAAYVTWARSKGLLRMPGESTAQTDGALGQLTKAVIDLAKGQKEDPAAAAAKSTVQMMAEASRAAIDVVKGQQDPQGIAAVIKAVKELMPAPLAAGAGAANPQLDIMRDELKALRDELRSERDANRHLQRDMLDLVKAQASGKDKSLISNIREMAETVAVMKEAFGGSEGPAEWWQMLTPHVGDFVKTLGNFGEAAKFMASRPAAPPRPGAAPQMTPAGLPPQPAPAPVPEQSQQPAGDPPAAQPPGGPPVELISFFQQVATPFMHYLRTGRSGIEFGDMLAREFGWDLVNHAQIKQVGKEQIVTMVKGSPAWMMIAPLEQRFNEFIDEFLEWEPAPAGDTPADAGVEMPPPPPPRRNLQ